MKNRGFTLIELLVAITMLSLTMTAVVTIFTASVRGQTKNLASEELLSQTSYVIEYMGRVLRMAKKDTVGNCVGTAHLNYATTSDSGIIFLNYQDECQEFRLDTTNSQLQERKSIDGSSGNFGPWVDLTSDKLKVISFNIGPSDSWDQNDQEQPRITIFFDIKSKASGLKPSEQPEIKIQTTVSQRNLDTTE